MQTAGEVFARCANRYGDKVDNAAWFMSLFQTALSREFHSLSREWSAHRDAEQDYAHDQSYNADLPEHEAGSLLTILGEASDELKTILTTIATAPAEVLSLLLAESDDDGWSRRLCRLCRTTRINDGVIAELRSLLAGKET